MRNLCWLIIICVVPLAAGAQEPPYIYKTSLIQAAPGKLLALIDLEREIAAETEKLGDPAPLWMRHSQGDRWDLLILYPIGSYSEYLQAGTIGKTGKAAEGVARRVATQHRVAGRCLRNRAGAQCGTQVL